MMKTVQKIRLIFAGLVMVLFCVGAYATTDIQPNGNVSGGNTAANCTQPILGTYSGSANFEAKWRANDVSLRWYNEDLKLDVQDAADTCSYDGVLNLPATPPSRTGYTFGGWKIKTISVPNGYTQLDYIENTGYAYIDTGLTVNAGPITIQAVFTPVSVQGSYGVIFGRDSNFQAAYTSAGKAQIGNAASSGTFFTMNTPVKVRGILTSSNNEKYYVNDAETGLSRNFRTGTTILLFAGNPSSLAAIGKMHSFIAKRNGQEIAHYYPARRNSDNAVGMYDTASGTFFTNAGSVTFNAGPAINE